jgi:hypothetical protein
VSFAPMTEAGQKRKMEVDDNATEKKESIVLHDHERTCVVLECDDRDWLALACTNRAWRRTVHERFFSNVPGKHGKSDRTDLRFLWFQCRAGGDEAWKAGLRAITGVQQRAPSDHVETLIVSGLYRSLEHVFFEMDARKTGADNKNATRYRLLCVHHSMDIVAAFGHVMCKHKFNKRTVLCLLRVWKRIVEHYTVRWPLWLSRNTSLLTFSIDANYGHVVEYLCGDGRISHCFHFAMENLDFSNLARGHGVASVLAMHDRLTRLGALPDQLNMALVTAAYQQESSDLYDTLQPELRNDECLMQELFRVLWNIRRDVNEHTFYFSSGRHCSWLIVRGVERGLHDKMKKRVDEGGYGRSIGQLLPLYGWLNGSKKIWRADAPAAAEGFQP